MTSVPKFYKGVISDVIEGVKTDFEDEGLELNALEELKKIWELKLSEGKAVDLESSESNTTASTYASLLSQQTQRTSASATVSIQRSNLTAVPSTLSQQHLVSTGSTQSKPIVRILANAQQGNNGSTATPIYHPQAQHVNQNQMLSNAAHVAQMALPNTIYPTNSQNTAGGGQGQQTIISNRVSLPAGATRSFQILRPTPEYRRLPYNHLASYNETVSGSQSRDGPAYPIRPMPNYSYVRPSAGHVIMAPNMVLQPGQHFGSSSVLTNNSGPAHPIPINHIAPNVINSTNGKSYMQQTDGAADSSSEDDDDDDIDDLVAVDHVVRNSHANRYQRGNSLIPDFIQPPDSLPPPHSTLTSVGGDGDDTDEDDEIDASFDHKGGICEEEEEKAGSESGKEEEQPLNSADDVSDEEADELFETENVVVCQYDKINRSRNKWRFHLKDGIMNLNGRDRLFQKANGDAEW